MVPSDSKNYKPANRPLGFGGISRSIYQLDGRLGGRVKISVEINSAQKKRLSKIAKRLNIPTEALASAVVRDMLIRRDDDFLDAVATVLRKNKELYHRLS